MWTKILVGRTIPWRLPFVVVLLLASRCTTAYRFAEHLVVEEIHGDGSNGQHSSSLLPWQAVTHLADIPPPSASVGCYREFWTRSDDLLSRYWTENAGFEKKTSSSDDKATATEDHQQTYGEVTTLGVRQLAFEMGISDSNDDNCLAGLDAAVVFYDLGSGVGRLATQMYVDQPFRIQKSVGVELSLDRHELALRALEDIQYYEEIPNLQDATSLRIQFLHGDATRVDWSDATHVFLSSLCFPDFVLKALQQTILKQPKIQVVAALNRLDLLCHSEEWVERQVHIQMSWGPGMAKVYNRVQKPHGELLS